MNRNWDNPANWFNITSGINDALPPTTADVQFGTGYTAPIIVNLNGDRTVGSLAFGVPASTTLTGGTLTVTNGLITVYGNQFTGTNAALPSTTDPVVTAPAIINSNINFATLGQFDVRGTAELQTNGTIASLAGLGVTRSGTGLWSIGGTANTFSSLTFAVNTGTAAITRFGDVGNAAGGSLGLNTGGTANRINWGAGNRLVFTGNTPNQTLSKDLALTFDASAAGVVSFETFSAVGSVGPNAGSITLAGQITANANVVNNGSNGFVIRAMSPTDPNFAVILSNNSNNYAGPTFLAGGILRLTANNALGIAGTEEFNELQLGSGATGVGPRTDATLQVNAGRSIPEQISTLSLSSPGVVYTIGTSPDFTSGSSTFTGTIRIGSNQPLTLDVNGGATLIFTQEISGSGATLIKTGAGTARLTAGGFWTADTLINGGTLHLSGLGSLPGFGPVRIQPGGTLLVDHNGSQNVSNRVPDTIGFSMFGGTVSLIGAPGTTINEIIGNTSGASGVAFLAGAATINVTTVGQSTTLTIGKFTRPLPSANNMGGTVNFTATGGVLGESGSNVRVLFGTAPTLTGGIIGGWATVNGSDWATYDANGVQALATYTPFASAAASDNALLSTAGATTTGPAAVNSLKITPPDTTSSLNLPGTLTITTGGILQTGGRPFTIASALATGGPTTDIVFHTDAGSTLTLSGGVTAAGLNKSGAGTLVLNSNAALASGGILTWVNVNDGTLRFIGDNRLPANALVMVNSPAAVGLDLNNTNQTFGNLQGLGNVNIGTGTLTLTGALMPAGPLAGTLSGSGALIKSGTSATQLGGDNSFTGTITVTGSTLSLFGVNATAATLTIEQVGQTAATLQVAGRGTLATASSSAITIGAGGTLNLRNDLINLTTSSATPTAANRADRIADGRPLIVGGGTIGFTGHGNPWVDATETLGAVTLNPGVATIRNTVISGGGASVLTFANLTRNSGAAVNFTATGGTLGGTGINPRVIVASGLGSNFLPWATVNGTAFAFYNGDGVTTNTNGFQALSSSAQTAFDTAGATNHALLTNSGSLSGAKTVLSLQINTTATGHSLNLGANNLVIGSGGLLKTGTQDYSITGTGTLGQAGTELIIHVAGTGTPPAGPILTVGVPIAAAGLVKAGTGVLNLTTNNSYAGPTTVGAGTLQVLNPISSASDSATGAGAVTTFPGTILLGGNATGTAGQIAGPLSVGGSLIPGALPGTPGILTVRDDVIFSANRTGIFQPLLGGNAVGTEYSQLRVIGGDVVLNGALFSPLFSGSPNGPLTIIEVTGGTVSGQFTTTGGAVLADGAVFSTPSNGLWFIDYTPTSVIVAPVPEPTSALAVCAIAAGLAGLVRRTRGRLFASHRDLR